jgi:hypothetical protein
MKWCAALWNCVGQNAKRKKKNPIQSYQREEAQSNDGSAAKKIYLLLPAETRNGSLRCFSDKSELKATNFWVAETCFAQILYLPSVVSRITNVVA